MKDISYIIMLFIMPYVYFSILWSIKKDDFRGMIIGGFAMGSMLITIMIHYGLIK